jgi:hypothetical protein
MIEGRELRDVLKIIVEFYTHNEVWGIQGNAKLVDRSTSLKLEE